jgi:hypothetical protein
LISFTRLVSVFGDPPVGVKVTLARTVALPVALSARFAFPFALIRSFTRPASTALAGSLAPRLERCATTPLPPSVSSPEPGTVTGSVAVPRFAFRFSFPKPMSLGGGEATTNGSLVWAAVPAWFVAVTAQRYVPATSAE